MAVDIFTGTYKNSLEEIRQIIKENKIEFIRLEYTDVLCINRSKLISVDFLDEIFTEGIAFCTASFRLAYDNAIVDSEYFSETCDDMRVIGDLSTFRILSEEEKTALVVGNLYYQNKPLLQSPRGFLQRMVSEYHKLGFDPIAAVELEFFVYKKNGENYVHETNACYIANKRLDPNGFLKQLATFFKKLSFHTLYMNHEYYPSQFEYNWKHEKALRAADEGTLFKSLSKDLAEENDLKLTFMAKPKNAEGGSGCHIHFSLNDLKTGENIFDDSSASDGLSDTLKYFIGGVLKHAKGLTAFFAPTVNCYKRFQPDSFAPIFVAWGYDNRTTYIRVPGERKQATRVEFRAASAAANPYLVIGGILAAGLDGIKNKILPPNAVTTDLYHDKEKQTEIVPTSLEDALNLLEEDQWLVETIGKELVELFTVLKSKEISDYNKYVTDWEYNTYSFHV